MAAPTSVSVSVDDTEYSRYEDAKNTITATVVVSGGAPYTLEPITLELRKARRSRDAVVASSTVVFSGTADTQEASVSFFLPDLVDQDLISLIRRGKYFVRAAYDDGGVGEIVAESGDFDLRIVSVERLKKDYLFGVPLKSTHVKAPKFPPQAVTGVTITETSTNHPTGFGRLSFNYSANDTSNAVAAIGTGTDGTVTIEADETGTSAGDSGNAFTVEVTVPAGTSPLSATLSGTSLTVALSVTAGVPNAGDNTATLIAAAVDALDEFSASASGTGADPVSAAEGPTTFTGGVTAVIRTLSWRDGPATSITGPGNYILRMGSVGPARKIAGYAGSNEYICVRVRAVALLPTTSVSEEILIDVQELDDSTLGRYLDQAIDWIEKDLLATHIEPTNVVTDRDPTTLQYSAGIDSPTPLFTDTDFDFLVSPLTYFLPKGGSWVQIKTPYRQLLRVDSLFGAIANTRVIDIDLEWIEHSEQGGFIQLVPFNQEVAFDFVGLIWSNAIRGAAELPNFWHFNMIVGLREPCGDLQELIGKKAAMEALLAAATAFNPGVGSLSLSRDGVSESVSYMNSQQYGIYTGAISAHKDWMETNSPLLRAKYRGLDWAVC